MNENEVEQTMLDDAQEAAQESYDELIEVLVKNGLMTRDEETFSHDLTIGFTLESWGADCPDTLTQAAIIENFFEELAVLTTTETLRVLAAYMKHADAANYVKSLEEDDDDA